MNLLNKMSKKEKLRFFGGLTAIVAVSIVTLLLYSPAIYFIQHLDKGEAFASPQSATVIQSQAASEPEVVIKEEVATEPVVTQEVAEDEPTPEVVSGASGGGASNEVVEEVVEEIVEEDTENLVVEDDTNEYYYEDNLIEVNTPFYGGGGGGVKTQTSTETPSPTPPDSPIITSPTTTYFATSTITFSGIASSTLIISNDYSSATTTADGDENWSLTLTDFSEGTTTIQFTATDSDDLDSDTTEYSVVVDLTAPTFSSFSILQCDYSLRSDGNCLSGNDTLSLTWSSTSTDISYYSITQDSASIATTTDTSSSQTLTNGDTYSIAIVAYDEAGNVATSTSQSVEIFTMPVVINEVAWSGTASSTEDEWIELYNRTSYAIDLSNIDLVADDEVPYASLSGSIATSSYYLIERDDDNTTSVSADLTIALGELSDTVEQLSLIHSSGGQASTTLDSTPTTSSCSSAWCAGTASSTYTSMERIAASTSGTDTSNWKDNNTYTKNGTDIGGNAINGTPSSQNSVSLESIGYYCPDETSSYLSGGYYTQTSGSCTYLSPTLSGNRYGDLFKGTIASSTIVNGHSLSSNATSTQGGDTLSSPVQGESYFTAIYVNRTGLAYNDVTDFRSYFQTGGTAPPHLDYGVLEWLYGVEP